MKKIGCLILATAALVLVTSLPAHAQRQGFGFRGGGSGGHQGSAFKGSSGGQQGFAFKGGHGHHGGHHHHSHSGTKFFVGVGAPLWWWGWGWPYYAYYPYYPSYPYYPYYYSDYSYYTYNPNDPYYPYYSVYPGQMTVQQSSRPAEPYYWYYCEGAQAYYPYVQQCPNGWMKVVPTPPSESKPNGPKPD